MIDPSLFETMFRDATDVLVLIQSDRTVRSANPAFRALVQQAFDGVDFMELVSPRARDRVMRELVRAAGGDEVLIEVPHPIDGNDCMVEYRFFPMDGGMVAGIGRPRAGREGIGEELGRTKAELHQKMRLLDEIQMELTQVPFVDPVTGVWNRLQVVERLTGEWSRAERWGHPLCCLLLEAEGIEDVRRREGDQVVDVILKAIARRVKAVVRDHDIVGRYGGNQFVIIAVHADLDGGRSLAARLSTGVSSEPITVAGRAVTVRPRIACCSNRSAGVEIMEDLFSVAESTLADAQASQQSIAFADE